MAADTLSRLLQIAGGGRATLEPGAELRDLERRLVAAEHAGDEQGAAEANARIDELFSQARQRDRDERQRQREAFSSGARTPLVKRPSPSQQMNQLLLKRYRGEF